MSRSEREAGVISQHKQWEKKTKKTKGGKKRAVIKGQGWRLQRGSEVVVRGRCGRRSNEGQGKKLEQRLKLDIVSES